MKLGLVGLGRMGAGMAERLRAAGHEVIGFDSDQGMVFIPFAFAEAAANLLTNPALDPVGKIPEFKFCAARVEKVAAAAE